jgi:small subunit ribosomal protein S19
MPRSIKKGPYVDIKLEAKVTKINDGSSKKGVIKTWSRRSTITPDFVGHTFAVHNGNKFIPVYVTEFMVGLPETLKAMPAARNNKTSYR